MPNKNHLKHDRVMKTPHVLSQSEFDQDNDPLDEFTGTVDEQRYRQLEHEQWLTETFLRGGGPYKSRQS